MSDTLSLLRWLLWPVGTAPPVHLRREGSEASAGWQRSGLVGFVLDLAPGLAFGAALVGVFGFASGLAVVLAVGRTLGDFRGVAPETALWGLPIAVLTRALLFVPTQGIDARLLQRAHLAMLQRFDATEKSPAQAAKVGGWISRDLPRFIEGMRLVPELAATAGAMLLCGGALAWVGGRVALLSALSAGLFLPVAWAIARKRAGLLTEGFAAVKRRVESLEGWLRHLRDVASWGVGTAVEQALVTDAEREVAVRDRDSVWRAVDLYSMVFGKVVPVALALLLASLLPERGSEPTTSLWISVLLIFQLYKLTRFASLLAEAQAAYASLREGMAPAGAATSSLAVDASWELWEGTLADNLLGLEARPWLEQLGLWDELALDEGWERFVLARGGRNVSAGQRTRLLLIRALVAQAREPKGGPINVRLPLVSLDPAAADRVGQLLAGLETEGRLRVEGDAREFLARQRARAEQLQQVPRLSPPGATRVEALSSKKGSPPAKKGALETFGPLVGMRWMPVALPVLLFTLTGVVSSYHRLPLQSAAGLLTLGAVGIAAAVLAGSRLERRARAWGIARYQARVHTATEPSADLFQVLGKDFSVLNERVAWYVHDVSWLLLIFVATSIPLLISFGIPGAAAVLGVSALYFGLGKGLQPAIATARRALVEGFNQSLNGAADAMASGSGNALNSIAARSREFSYQAVDLLFRRTLALDATKAFALNAALLMSGLFAISVVALAQWIHVDEGVRAFLGTGVVNIDLKAMVLFSALAGLETTRISVERLAEEVGADDGPGAKEGVRREGEMIHVEGVPPVLLPAFPYASLALQSGRALSLTGVSGSGKSLYLLALERHAGGAVVRFGAHTSKALEWLSALTPEQVRGKTYAAQLLERCQRCLTRGATLVLLDEALAPLGVAEAQEWMGELEQALRRAGAAALVVDHRFELSERVPVTSLLPAGTRDSRSMQG